MIISLSEKNKLIIPKIKCIQKCENYASVRKNKN